jgi:hypothetical protein
MQPDNPNPYVYDTALFEAAIEQKFKPQMALLHELCCYGSNLIMRCYTEKENNFEDLVIVGCLLRQFLVHLAACRT